MSWLIDTNVVSELVRPKPDAAVVGWMTERVREEAALHISALTLAEIRRGALRLDPSHPRYARLQVWATVELPTRFAGRVLAFDELVARSWAEMTAPLARGLALPLMDSLIAATARHHGLVVVTRNVVHFRRFDGLVVENPWAVG